MKLNRLPEILPEYILVDPPWLAAQGYSGVLVSKYAAAGWLARPVRGIFMRPGCNLRWQAVIVSLQNTLGRPLSIGGLSALEMQGRAHFIYPQMPARIYLHGAVPPPPWLSRLALDKEFIFRPAGRLFAPAARYQGKPVRRFWDAKNERFYPEAEPAAGAIRTVGWSEKGFPLQVSMPERAMLEVLDEAPARYRLDDADVLIDGLSNMNPQLLQGLLEDCTSVKVKRLALWFVERHWPRLLDHIDTGRISLGSGNRHLAAGGFLDRKYKITMPEHMRNDWQR